MRLMNMNTVKHGMYVSTSKRNYGLEIIFSSLYFLILTIVVIQISFLLILVVPILTILFYRWVEFMLTGVYIQFAFSSLEGKLAKWAAYQSLFLAIFFLILFIYLALR